jgi:hypothetical protein
VIRPSILQRAEVCGYVPVLAEKYPETGDAAEGGKKVHAEIAAHLKHGDECTSLEAMAACAWVDSQTAGKVQVEKHASLIDPVSMEIITEGTPDLVVGPDSSGTMLIVDWKTGNPDNVAAPDDNLQMLAYGLAVSNGDPFQVCLVFLDGDKVDARWSRTFESDEQVATLDRVKAAANREPSPHPGEHCGSCWQRRYCHAWQAREGQALALIEQDRTLTVTDENAGQIMARAKAVKEAAETAEAIVKAHVRNGGKCIVDGKELVMSFCKGRESADVKALKEAGLTDYIKQGASYERSSWKKVTPA